LQLWSRKNPVCALGVGHDAALVSDPLRYDYSCAAGGTVAHLRPGRDGLTVELPGGPGAQYALPLNVSVVDDVTCEGATALVGQAHLFFAPARPGGASCRVRFLGTIGGVRRLLSRKSPPSSAPFAAAR